jgi:ferredoxin
MKVMVNSFVCDGHHECASAAPKMFKIGTDNKAYALSNSVPAEFEEVVRAAARQCPMHAIMVLEEPQ